MEYALNNFIASRFESFVGEDLKRFTADRK